MPQDEELTTTSYAILALLAVRPWTTYELAKQMGRSVAAYWPRAESRVYEEPKRLVELGLATASHESTGRRPRTVYAITETGRESVRRWLDRPGAGPRLEFEAMLQVAFADHGSREQLVALLETIHADALARQAVYRAQAADYAETGGPFPDRLPVINLVVPFLLDSADLLVRWSEWALQEVSDWSGTSAGDGAAEPRTGERDAIRAWRE